MDTKHRISYTARDRATIKEELLKLVPRYTDKWTDFNESDPGVVIVELLAALGDMLFYAIDREALERFLLSASEKKNIRGILKSYGYKIPSYRSAEVYCNFTTTHDIEVVIPKYLTVSTNAEDGDDAIYFTIYSDGNNILSPSTPLENIKAIQGKRVIKEYTYGDIVNNQIKLPDQNVAEGTLEVKINGSSWTEVEDVLLQSDSGKYFSMDFDKYDNVYVSLFPGWENLVYDPKNCEIEISYLVSLGSKGRVGSYMIKNIEDPVYDINGVEVTDKVTVTNPQGSISGEDPADVQDIKTHAIEFIKTMWSIVTLNDYETHSKNFSGVANALAVDWSIPESGIEEPYIVDLYIVPTDGGSVSSILRDELTDYINKRKMATSKFNIKDVQYYTIELNVDVLVRGGSVVSSIESNIHNALKSFFTYKDRKFGEHIKLTTIKSLIEDVDPNIVSVTINVPSSDITVPFTQFPILGNVTLNITS